MDPYILQVVTQLPIVALFIWYNERREERAHKERLERDREWREWMTAQENARTNSRTELHTRMSTDLARLADAVTQFERANIPAPPVKNS